MTKILSKYFVMPIVWLLIGVTSFVFFILDALVWLLTFWWDKRLWVLHRYSCVWALFYIWINPFWRIDIKGKENVRKNQPYIIVSNHQSSMDIVILHRLWMHFKWVAKRELFKIPVIGWNLWLNNHIAIERTRLRGAVKMIKQSQEHLAKGSSVLIFPEGTRSIDGKIRKFKDGAFALAKKSNYPILPVVIEGTSNVLSKNGYTIKGSQTFRIRILPEISPESFQNKTVDELTLETQNFFAEEHSKLAPHHYQE